MSWIKVSWQSAAAVVADYQTCQRELTGAVAAVRGVQSSRCLSGRGFSALYTQMGRAVDQMEDETLQLEALEQGLCSVLETYLRCEQDTVERLAGEETGAAGEESEEPEESEEAFDWGTIWKLISSAGIVGNGISAVGNAVTGDWSAKTLVGSGKYLLKLIGGISGTAAKGADANWKEALFGLNNGLAGLDVSSAGKAFTSSLSKQFGKDLSFSQAATAGDKLKVATKWGGYILSAGSNLLENMQEFAGQEGSGGRMVAETVIETGVDIGVGALATAAVSAGAAALVSAGVIASAPAVAIGAGAVAVTWAANGVCEWITGGKDLGEVAADLVCDTAEAIGDGVNAAVKWAKSLFSW